MDYTAEQAANTMANWTLIFERLGSGNDQGLRSIELAIDLKRAVVGMPRHLQRTVRRFIETSHKPATYGGKFVDPVTLIEQARALEAEEEIGRATMIMHTVREIRTARTVAAGMSGRRARPAIATVVDRRLRGKSCARCGIRFEEGQTVMWDRDWGGAWHQACE